MQIKSVQNIIRSNFKYKNNPINFGIKYDTSTQKGDIVELSQKLGVDPDEVVTSKRYYMRNHEFDQNLLMQNGDRLFILRKGVYVPYGGHLEECNAKGEIIRRTTFNNGAKFIVNHYKNGNWIQEVMFEDMYSNIDMSKKRTSVVKFDGLDKSGKNYKQTFGISRNYGKNWKNHPSITMRKNTEDCSLFVLFSSPLDEKRGDIVVDYTHKDKRFRFETNIYDQKGYSLRMSPDESTNETAYLALIELKETIQSEEFRAEFGDNDIFNSELDKAIEFLSSKLNAG